MTLLGGKNLLIIVLVAFGATYLLGRTLGYIHIADYKCAIGRSYQWDRESWNVVWAWRQTEFRIKNQTFDCDKDAKYNPKTQETRQNGASTEIVPKGTKSDPVPLPTGQ